METFFMSFLFSQLNALITKLVISLVFNNA
ncbi:hypothetical protein CY0110_18197 [Crocosphaera chwakensis CCY0110]|uniref:Uncharacterized protein n=1 Tax=Crocosphaera chwakensis CCY0110 TaxID=391612 RepID=A3IIX1_9CHRO|nr:hypothetical protein CY0110_18197 [Crocosphaera chwakensis CCY0110]